MAVYSPIALREPRMEPRMDGIAEEFGYSPKTRSLESISGASTDTVGIAGVIKTNSPNIHILIRHKWETCTYKCSGLETSFAI